MKYDEYLTQYYNNNQKFLQKRLEPKVIRNTKIFEKTQIKWFSLDEIKKNKKQFRSFYQNIVDLILADQSNIDSFVRRSLSKKSKVNRKTSSKKTRKNKH
jgi:transcription termination factor NusB